MRKFLFIALVILLPTASNAQVDLSAGMGINFINTSSLTDYINMNFAPASDQLATFNTQVGFFGECDYSLSPNFQLGLEYVYSIYSFNTSYCGIGTYDLSLNIHNPSALAYYVVNGEGYKFKFGGGAGLRLASLEEQLPATTQAVDYSSTGFGLLLKIVGNTRLGGNIYAYIAGDARYDFVGEPESDGKKLTNNSLDENVNANSLSVGIKLGISIFL
ncbi:MAG: hypothetical protein V1720_21315 [bacterium]